MSFDPSLQGTKNYIADRDGTKIGKWVTYAGAAQTNPVDGTGGAPASTFAVSTDSTMRGVTNFLWTHSADDRQGEGFSYDFSIDPSDKGKVLQCSFEYLISSGTYADNDMSVWIYDVTNAVLIQPAPYLIKNSGIIEKFAVEFQTASNSTSYRLIFHVDTATATAYTIRFTNFNLGPQAKLYGSAITDPVAYTPTFTGLGTVTGINFVSWREGANLLVKGTFTTGTPTATEARISLGFGGGNSNVTALSTLPTLSAAGTTEVTNFSSTVYKISALIEPSVSYITMGNQTSTVGGLSKQNGNALFGASVTVSVLLEIPIQGWSSSQVFSQDADVRVVAAKAGGSTSSSVSASGISTIIFPTLIFDTHGTYSTSTGLYTVLVPGKYSLYGSIQTNAASAASIDKSLALITRKNGTTSSISGIKSNSTASRTVNAIVSDEVDCVAGDTLAIGWFHDWGVTLTLDNDTRANIFTIARIAGPAQVAASESVAALYTGAPPTGTLNGSLNNVTFGTKVKDSHNAMSGATYTVPVSGTYSISATVAIIGTRVLGSTDQLNILVNGASIASNIQNAGGAIGTQYPLSSVLSYPILAGQTVTVKVATSSTTPSYDSTAPRAYFSIIRTGNY